MGRKTRIRKIRPNQTERKKGSPVNRSPKMSVDVEEMLESSVISTNDGTIRTKNGIKVGDQIPQTPKRCRSLPTENAFKRPNNKLVSTLSPITRGRSKRRLADLRPQAEKLHVLLTRLNPLNKSVDVKNVIPTEESIEPGKVEPTIILESSQVQQPETTLVSKPASLRSIRRNKRYIQTSPETISYQATAPDAVTVVNIENKSDDGESKVNYKPLNSPDASSSEPSDAIISPKVAEERLKSPDRYQYLLKQLESTLSPKLTEPKKETNRPVSRYGRIQKQKENNDYIPMNVAKFITKFSPRTKPIKVEKVVELLSESEEFEITVLNFPPTSPQQFEGNSTSEVSNILLVTDSSDAANEMKQNMIATDLLPVHDDILVSHDSEIPEPATQQNENNSPVSVDTVCTEKIESELIPDPVEPPLIPDSVEPPLIPDPVEPHSIAAEYELSSLSECLEAPPSMEALDTIAELIPTGEILGIDQIKILDLDASFSSSINDTEIVVESENISPMKTMEKSPDADSANGSSIDHEVMVLGEEPIKGQLGWGALSNKVLHWPCMVCADPTDGKVIKFKNTAKKLKVIHVTFFADNGRRSWIPESLLLPFVSMEEYKILIDKQWRHLKRKISTVLKPNHPWMEAIKQANEMLQYSIESREQRFQALLELESNRPKQMRKRAKSSSAGFHSNSFGESFESTGGKRRRSPTPESPAYEPISATDLDPEFKRIKLEPDDPDLLRNTITRYFQSMTDGSDMMETASGTSSECDDISEMAGFDREAYNHLLNMSRIYVFEGQTEADIDKKLQKYVQKICSLRMQSAAGAKNARVSNRLRSQALRNSFLKFEMELGIGQIKKDPSPVGANAPTKVKKEPKTLEQLFIFTLEKNYLMKGVPKGFVCVVCYKPNDVSKCSKCYNFYHPGCVQIPPNAVSKPEKTVDSKAFVCPDCSTQKAPICFVCQDQEETIRDERKHRCTVTGCGKYYHFPCLRLFPQHKLTSTPNSSTLFCPYHTCHTCVSDDPRTNATTTKGQLMRCVKCPSSYHTDAKCIPAGSQLLTSVALICPKHSLEKCSLNVNWCFLCCKGGSLICCETCPTAFHLECLKFIPPEGKYICEECESGRMPLYNEVVWAKYSHFRFWPALIVPPPMVPEFMHRRPHEVWDICIKFFGSHDYGWINRRRIYLYQEGDSENVSERKQVGILVKYNEALREAKAVHGMLQAKKTDEDADQADSSFKPPMYVKIRSNRYVPPLKPPSVGKEAEEENVCECKPSDSDPCGPDSNCINRALLIECNPKVCPTRERCQNQCFEKKQYPALAAKRIPNKGWGLVAQEDIRVGRFVIEYVGEVVNNDELARRLQQKKEQKDENWYFLTVDSELTIDAGPRGNLARFINHSCEPNCETLLWNVGGAQSVGLFAIKDIKAGDELTFNYNFESTSDEKKICHCGASKCSGFIGKKYRPPVEEESTTAKSRGKAGKSKVKRRRHSAHPSVLSLKKRKISVSKEPQAVEIQSGTGLFEGDLTDGTDANSNQSAPVSSL
ncbi:nuclear receptor binding SET domain protein-like [Malaya genurostris]|uniref:nuclear receptor binding SET domain protein-like n=1 Tax=Malaya genurostris TaxID=325434 RepID=UPI0026F3E92D|nr:nuclear receptor binding SET domain protein-like [Malaya genurostris]